MCGCSALEEVANRDKNANGKVAELLGVSQGIAHGISAHLLRLGLVATGGMSFMGLHAEVRLADFGREVLVFLRAGEWRTDGHTGP